MGKRQVTMQQIAAELGLSRRTVSSVVNNRARARRISRETEELVRRHLRQRGYAPSLYARHLRMGIPNSVGILYSGDLYSHLTEAFNQLVARLRPSADGIEVMIVPQEHLADGLEQMVARGIRGLIWINRARSEAELGEAGERLPYLSHFETVVIYNHRFDANRWDRVLADSGIHLIGVDREEGFFRLGLFLKRLGHARVLIPCPPGHAVGERAEVGLRRAGLEVFRVHPEIAGSGQAPSFEAALAAEIAGAARVHAATAACFMDDQLAGLVMTELLARGVRIPGDLTVTGFDGMPFAAALAVPLTTLRVPVREMVDRVARILAKPPARRRHCFPLVLEERGSHGPARVGSPASKAGG